MSKSVFENYEKLKEAIESTHSMSDAIKYLGLRAAGGNFKSLKYYCALYDIKLKHGTFENKIPRVNKVKLESLLIENSTYSRGSLKRRLVSEGILEYKCTECGIDSWNGKAISLQLDHINGVYNDNRLENIRFLCPNCHTQTETYAGKGTKKLSEYFVKKIKQPKIKVARKSKISWPNAETLQFLVNQMPVTHIAKQLGVSDVAVHKKLKQLGVEKPPVGTWAIKY